MPPNISQENVVSVLPTSCLSLCHSGRRKILKAFLKNIHFVVTVFRVIDICVNNLSCFAV